MPERRQATDRRNAADRRRRDRRRKNDARVFAIELTANELRVAQLERGVEGGAGDQVSAFAVRWRKDAPNLASPEGLAELTVALRDIARRFSMFTAEIRILLGGDYCITRSVRGTVEEVRAELQRLEQRSRLYLSLGPGEKVLVSHTRLLDARHAQALAAACNKRTLEAVQTAAENAGLEITVIEPALSALARAVNRLPNVPAEPYLLVHMTEAATEIAIVHEGRLLLDYRPGGVSGTTDLPSLLGSHLNRLNRHVARYLRTSTALKHVFLYGEDQLVRTATEQFRKRSSLEVRIALPAEVQATWRLVKDAAQTVSAPALGGLLVAYLPADECVVPNLMQHILEGRQEPLRPRVIRSCMPMAAVLLLSLGMSWITAGQRRELAAMQAEADSLAVAAAKATELRLQLTTADLQLTQLKKLAGSLPGDLGIGAVRQLGACMPGDVWLSSLLVTDRRNVQLQGASYLEAGVYDFVHWLELAPGFTNVALKRTTAAAGASGAATSFELELTLGDLIGHATRVARHE